MPFLRPPTASRSPARRPVRAVDPASTRTMTLCPPLFPETTWGDRLRGTVDRLVGPWRGPRAEPSSSLDAPTRPWFAADRPDDSPGRRAMRALQAEFDAVLDDLDVDDGIGPLRTRVSLALGERDLWNLRPAVFEVLARHRGEAEARRRVARLDRHFPRRDAGAPIAGWRRAG